MSWMKLSLFATDSKAEQQKREKFWKPKRFWLLLGWTIEGVKDSNGLMAASGVSKQEVRWPLWYFYCVGTGNFKIAPSLKKKNNKKTLQMNDSFWIKQCYQPSHSNHNKTLMWLRCTNGVICTKVQKMDNEGARLSITGSSLRDIWQVHVTNYAADRQTFWRKTGQKNRLK